MSDMTNEQGATTPDPKAEAAGDRLRGILTRMGMNTQVTLRTEPDRVILDVQGEDASLAIGKHGATLDSLQYLVQRMLMRPGDEGERRLIIVDAEGYRGRREEALVEMANRLAEKATRTGKPVPASPMSAADRRVMHLALSKVEGVRTESEGEGAERRLMVVPTGGAKSDGA